MAEILLLHHAQGLTDGVLEFADTLHAAGHTVHTPDLYNGKTFDTIDDGMKNAERVGFGEIAQRGIRAAEDLPEELVYAGFSLGVMPAQQLAQNRPGARGALLMYSFVAPESFGSWPAGLPAQVHGMDGDPFFADEGDIDAARVFVKQTPEAELFVYPGESHLFADSSLADYDEAAAALLTERVLAFLDRL